MDLAELNQEITGQFSRHPWESARIKVVKDIITKLGIKPSLILDLGCGDLFVANALATDYPDCKIIAVDTAFQSEYVKEENERSVDTRIYLNQRLEEVPKDMAVSLVLLLDVIEHLEDDVTFLRLLYEHPCISDSTTILITAPAYQSLWTSHDLILGHFRRYTNETLEQNALEAGFSCEEAGYFFASPILARFLETVKERLTGTKKENTDVGEWNRSDRVTKCVCQFTHERLSAFAQHALNWDQAAWPFKLYSMQKTCIVVPCYNEAKRLDTATIASYLRTHRGVTIAFVNDGSRDDTLEVLETFQKNEPSVVVVNLQENQGKAEAVRQGMTKISQDFDFHYIGYWDADLATPLSEIEGMVNILSSNEQIVAVLGSRVQRLGARIERDSVRHYFGRVFATVAAFILQFPVYDTQCGAKLFRSSIVAEIFK